MQGNQLKLGIVVSKFNQSLTTRLLSGAQHTLGPDYRQNIQTWFEHQAASSIAAKDVMTEERLRLVATKFLNLEATLELQLIEVPGSYELPLGAQWLANAGVDGIVALGVLIQGSTPHFKYISSASSNGLMEIGLKYNLPVGFGVITANSFRQASERASLEVLKPATKEAKKNSKGNKSNKGCEAALSVLEMLMAKELQQQQGKIINQSQDESTRV